MSVTGMKPPEKVCPIVIRLSSNGPEVLAFLHPSAGKQFVKGTIKAGEEPLAAAKRELLEESGLITVAPLTPLGSQQIGEDRELWYFFKYVSSGLPETWSHQAVDDFGHTFEFLWHPLNKPLDENWLPVFHEAFMFFAPVCSLD